MIGFYGYMKQCETCTNRDYNSLGYCCAVLEEKKDTGNGTCNCYEQDFEKGKKDFEQFQKVFDQEYRAFIEA